MTALGTEPRLARLDSLTGLRFYAAAAVILKHTVPDIWPMPVLVQISAIGSIGVGFFFVLSGFILTWTWAPGQSKPGFYVRRAARIMPLHILTTVVAVLLAAVDGDLNWFSSIVSLVLLQAWGTEAWRLGGNGPSWSLSVEVFFYACFPLIISKLSGSTVRRCFVLVGALLAAMVLWIAGYGLLTKIQFPDFTVFSPYTNPVYRMGEFLTGMALGVAMRRGWIPRTSLRSGVLVAISAFTALAAVNYLVVLSGVRLGDISGLPLSILDLMYLPITMLLIVSAAASDSSGRRGALASKWHVRLGEWSFAMYLVQMIVITQVVHYFGRKDISGAGFLLLLGTLGVCVGLSAALHYWVERPAERALKARFAPRLTVFRSSPYETKV